MRAQDGICTISGDHGIDLGRMEKTEIIAVRNGYGTGLCVRVFLLYGNE